MEDDGTNTALAAVSYHLETNNIIMPTYLQAQTLIRWDGWDIECTMLKALGTKVHHLNGGCQTPEQHFYTNSWIIHSCAGRLLQKLLVLNTFIGRVQCGI